MLLAAQGSEDLSVWDCDRNRIGSAVNCDA